jgi:hypothetical protein
MAVIHPLSPGFEDQMFRRRINAAAGLNTATYLFIEITSCLRMIYAIAIEGKLLVLLIAELLQVFFCPPSGSIIKNDHEND